MPTFIPFAVRNASAAASAVIFLIFWTILFRLTYIPQSLAVIVIVLLAVDLCTDVIMPLKLCPSASNAIISPAFIGTAGMLLSVGDCTILALNVRAHSFSLPLVVIVVASCVTSISFILSFIVLCLVVAVRCAYCIYCSYH